MSRHCLVVRRIVSRFRFPAGAEVFLLSHSIETDSGAHPASYSVRAGGSIPRVKELGAWSWYLEPRLRIHGTIPPRLHMSSWHGTGVHLFRTFTPCIIIYIYHIVPHRTSMNQVPFCLAYSSTLKMEAKCSSETSVVFQRTIRRYIHENRTLHNHCYGNLKSYKPRVFILFSHSIQVMIGQLQKAVRNRFIFIIFLR
jgi:hypothetical protein